MSRSYRPMRGKWWSYMWGLFHVIRRMFWVPIIWRHSATPFVWFKQWSQLTPTTCSRCCGFMHSSTTGSKGIVIASIPSLLLLLPSLWSLLLFLPFSSSPSLQSGGPGFPRVILRWGRSVLAHLKKIRMVQDIVERNHRDSCDWQSNVQGGVVFIPLYFSNGSFPRGFFVISNNNISNKNQQNWAETDRRGKNWSYNYAHQHNNFCPRNNIFISFSLPSNFESRAMRRNWNCKYSSIASFCELRKLAILTSH